MTEMAKLQISQKVLTIYKQKKLMGPTIFEFSASDVATNQCFYAVNYKKYVILLHCVIESIAAML